MSTTITMESRLEALPSRSWLRYLRIVEYDAGQYDADDLKRRRSYPCEKKSSLILGNAKRERGCQATAAAAICRPVHGTASRAVVQRLPKKKSVPNVTGSA